MCTEISHALEATHRIISSCNTRTTHTIVSDHPVYTPPKHHNESSPVHVKSSFVLLQGKTLTCHSGVSAIRRVTTFTSTSSSSVASEISFCTGYYTHQAPQHIHTHAHVCLSETIVIGSWSCSCERALTHSSGWYRLHKIGIIC